MIIGTAHSFLRGGYTTFLKLKQRHTTFIWTTWWRKYA